MNHVKYRHSMYAPANWTSAIAWLCKHPFKTCQMTMTITSMTHVYYRN